MKKPTVKYSKGEIGRVKIVEDFLPSPNRKMELDNPILPEFASWRSYEAFSRRIRRTRRYVWSDEVQAFLDTVLATLRKRDMKISSGQILFRAQLGVRHKPVLDDDGVEIGEEPVGFCASRMKPRLQYAKEGRVNSTGISVLYLASEEETAISEVRPWVGSEVSVAQFKILRDLNAVNLSVRYGKSSIERLTFAHLLGDELPSAQIKERAVWTSIDNAFRNLSRGVMIERIMLRRKFLPSFSGKPATKQSSTGVNLEKKAITSLCLILQMQKQSTAHLIK